MSNAHEVVAACWAAAEAREWQRFGDLAPGWDLVEQLGVVPALHAAGRSEEAITAYRTAIAMSPLARPR